jgi:hypothetical protein
MLGVGTGTTGSAVLPLAGRELEGVGEAGTDGVGAGEGVVLGRGDGFGVEVGFGREGSGRVEDRTPGSAVRVEPSGTTRCPSRKYAYQARTVRRYAAEWL